MSVGLSSHPPAAEVTGESQAFVHHQIVQALRAGTIGGTTFTKVIGVGHSEGTTLLWLQAATYHDIDGVIATGFLHGPAPATSGLFASFYPAQLDPKFVNAGLPLGYITTMPGTRAAYFYNTAVADPTIIALDEFLKQAESGAGFADIGVTVSPTTSQQINVPVLSVMGQTDILFCDPSVGLSCADGSAVAARENFAYSPAACLEAAVQPLAGHSIALHPNAATGFSAMLDWANRRVGTDSSHPATEPCTP
jgi:hypothetical protein